MQTTSITNDIMDSEVERTLWIVGREMERPPYFHVGKGGDTRLARALRVCVEGRITPNSDGSYTVEGSEHRLYRVADSCSCPQSQKASSRWCYHAVSVAVYVEWQRRLRTTPSYTAPRASDPDDDALGNGFPVDDETLPLPLPPMTVEERLASTPEYPFVLNLPEEGLVRVAPDGSTTPVPVEDRLPLGTMHDATALSPHHTPQEDRMTADADAYIPEPDTAPVATLEPPTPEPAPVTQAVARGHALLVQEDDLEQALTLWTAQRQIVQRFLKHQLIAGTDYYQLRIGKGESKPSLSKAGAEKVLSWLKWSASFTPDTGTWEMLGRPTDVVCFVCHLHTRSGEIVGEGRGARSLKKDGGDINKAIKMAEKSSMVSAVLRTGALSDCFTQDVEDMQDEPAKPTPAKPTAQELRQRIWALVTAQAPQQATTREAVTTWIRQVTGYELVPDNYATIVRMLETRA